MLSSGTITALSTSITSTTALYFTYIYMESSPHSTSEGFDSSNCLWGADSHRWESSLDCIHQLVGLKWVDVIGIIATKRRRCLVANESPEIKSTAAGIYTFCMRSSCHFISIHESLPSTVNTAGYSEHSWPHNDVYTCTLTTCTTTNTGMPRACTSYSFIRLSCTEERIICAIHSKVCSCMCVFLDYCLP